MDGYTASKHIKATVKGQATAIMALTASSLKAEIAMLKSAGCDDFILKPFREEKIFIATNKYLGIRYIYGEINPMSKLLNKIDDRLSLDLLNYSAIPSDLLELAEASSLSEMKKIDKCIEEISHCNSSLADTLADLAQ